jgi:redox-sensitive bicupin YhaK (pirin superfamily)
MNQVTELYFNLASGRHAWLQVLRGTVNLNNNDLSTSDGVAISNETKLALTATSPAELMLFDLA